MRNRVRRTAETKITAAQRSARREKVRPAAGDLLEVRKRVLRLIEREECVAQEVVQVGGVGVVTQECLELRLRRRVVRIEPQRPDPFDAEPAVAGPEL